jgi:NADH:ubiquinone oxidoreductase subunit E
MKKEEILSVIHNFPPRREYLIRMLHSVQDKSGSNYIPRDALNEIVRYTKLSMSAVQGVVEYYSMFSDTPRGKYLIRICFSPVCINHEAEAVLKVLLKHFNIKSAGMVSNDGLISIEKSECLGRCGNGTTISINTHYFENVTVDNICKEVEDYIKTEGQ